MVLLLTEAPVDLDTVRTDDDERLLIIVNDKRGVDDNVGGKPDSVPCIGVAVEYPGVLLVIVDCVAVARIVLVMIALPESVGTAVDEVDDDINEDEEEIPDSWGEAERLTCVDGVSDDNAVPVIEVSLVDDEDIKGDDVTELVDVGTDVITEVDVSELYGVRVILVLSERLIFGDAE
jgi:hypothetical protein